MKKLRNPFRTSLGYMPCTKELSDMKMLLATIENNHYESGENHQKKVKKKK